jgi:ribulose-5-phosphate 4-epimerase/fuculose-1-phosphate aldolase
MAYTAASKQEIKRRVALACRIAYEEGLREEYGSEYAGHISVRLASSNTVIMPGHLHDQGGGLPNITVGDIIEIDMNGKRLEGVRDVVEEYYIHTYIYKARPEIHSVLHMHPPAATALGSTDGAILPISLRACYFAEGVPVLLSEPGIIDSDDIAERMIKVMGKHNALIHRGHGIVTAGRNLEEACLTGMYLEGAARFQILASNFGKLKPYTKAEAIKHAKSHSLDKRQFPWWYFEKKWAHLKI